jgi:tetratricopeptide (TPR) repeat protein/predicted Ser/Thr protein kinase
MNPDRWRRVKEVFHLALDRAPEERPPFLANACEGDDELRAEVERLLIAHVNAGSFIETSPVAGLAQQSGPVTATLTGRSLDHYRVGRLIGAGGMGEVYAARDTDLDREVALKVVGSGGSAAAQLALRREAQRASQLNHPNICTIHEVGVFEGQAYIVMEYVEGSPLSDVIGSEGLPLETMLRYGIHVADALAHAHGQGIVHRDLKSANVAVTSDGRAKVLDFGLAHAVAAEHAPDMTQTRAPSSSNPPLAGTLSHMAPELLRGAAPSSRSDIWALGVVLYEMASGHRPFDGDTSFELSAAILHAAPATLPARIPASLQAIIRRCLAKDPHERYGQAIEVRSALEAVQAEVSTGASHTIVAPRAQRVVRALRATAVVIALAIAAVVAGAFTWRWMNGSGEPVAVGAAGRPAVAVMPFDNMAGTEDTAWLSKGLPSMLLTGLAQTRGLDIVSPQRLQEIVKQIGGQSLESLDRAQVPDVARRAGAGAVVVGSIFKVGNEIRIDAQLEDLSNARVLVAESVRGTDVFALVDQLAARIRDGIGFQDATSIRRVSDVSTTSLEAFRLYSQAEDAMFNSRMDDAEELLERAVAIDPTFADAYVQLANASRFRGFVGLQREYLRKAADHADRLGERHRLILEAESARAEGDSATAARAIDELIEKFPDTDQAYAIGAGLYAPVTGVVYDPAKWLTTSGAGAAALPGSMLTRMVFAYTLLGSGRYEEALGEFDAYVRLAPREPNPFDSLAEAYLVMGDPEKALETYSRALTIDPAFTGSRIGRAWSLASLGRYDDAILEGPGPPQYLLANWTSVRALVLSRVGRYREARQAIETGSREPGISENAAERGIQFLVLSFLAIEREEYERALQDSGSAERTLASLPEETKRVGLVLVHLMSGLAQVRAGRVDRARGHLEMQERLFNSGVEPENWWHNALEGEIALATGDLEKAASTFSAGQPSKKMWFSTFNSNLSILANNLMSRDGLARVAKAREDLPRAIQIYRQLLSYGPDQKWVSAFEPRYVLEIARLLDRSGNSQAALKEYQRFLEFWKRADPGLPELPEARRAVERLLPVAR